MVKKLCLLFIMLFFVSGVFGQSQVSDQSLFDEGVEIYKSGEYAAAQAKFIKILKLFPNSRIQTAVKFMLGKTYFKTSNFRSGLIVCESFAKNHQDSKYLDDISLLKGQIYFQQKKYSDAVAEWIRVTETSIDKRLVHRAQNYIFNTLSYQLTNNQLDQIQLNTPDAEGIKKIVKLNKLYYSGEAQSAKQQSKQFIKRNAVHPYNRFAYALISGEDSGSKSSNRFVFLKNDDPQSNPVVNAIAGGLLYAEDEFETRNPGISIVVDTVVVSPGVLSSIQAVQQEIESDNPMAFISALGKDANAGLALYSKYESFPLIIPTQSETGITEISPQIFQLSPDNEMKGKTIGRYATQELGFKTFAILAPANKYGQELAQSFEAAVLENGGEIVESQWYYEDTESFSRQLKAIRKKGFFIAFRDSVLAADSTVTPDSIKAKFTAYRNEMLFADENVHGKVDSTQIPSTGIHGTYIVIYPDLIPYIAPQFAFHNIETTLLGNEGWNDREQLELQRIYLDGLIYTNAGYYDRASWNYSEFTSRFRQRIRITPQFYHLLGYDVGKWMLMNYKKGISRNSFYKSLTNHTRYEGILINVEFGNKPRINSEINLVKFFSGRSFKLK